MAKANYDETLKSLAKDPSDNEAIRRCHKFGEYYYSFIVPRYYPYNALEFGMYVEDPINQYNTVKDLIEKDIAKIRKKSQFNTPSQAKAA